MYSIEEYADTKLTRLNTVARDGEGEVFDFSKVCKTLEFINSAGSVINRCRNSAMPLDFVYSINSNSYRLDKYNTDQKLLE